MRARLSSLILLALGGVLAAATMLGVTQPIGGTPLAAAPAAGATSDTVSRFRSEAPTLDELEQPTGDTGEAPALYELQQPTRNLPLTPQAQETVRKTTGKLYAKFRNYQDKVGTATIVDSDSRDLVITAAHLLVSEGQSAYEVRFVPGAEPDRAPHGQWYGREWATVPGSDVAMVLLYPRNNEHIQNKLDSQGICFDCEQKPFVHVYGYPYDLLGGQALDTHCQVNADFSAGPAYPYGSCLEGKPALDDGAGGSAVLANFDTNKGRGVITAIHTSVFPDATGQAAAQGAAFLGSAAREVYRTLQGKSSDPVNVYLQVTNHGAFNAETTVLLPDGFTVVCKKTTYLTLQAAVPELIACPIPGGGSFTIIGTAITGRSKEIIFPVTPSSLRACFAYYGTTRFGFDFKEEKCE